MASISAYHNESIDPFISNGNDDDDDEWPIVFENCSKFSFVSKEINMS